MIQENSNKLKGRVFRVSKRVKSCPGSENYPVYGVTNKEGVIITGKDASFNLENYIVVEGQKFVYNPYRINVGSIGLTAKDFQGIVSPAYVVFEVKDIVPEVLFTFLKSDRGNRLINWYGNHGSVRKALRFSDLEKIDFPEIEKERQLLIAKKFSITADTVNSLRTNNDFDFKHIQKLRQAILSEAIQGKLVPQDPNDEPASVLLEKIKAEKQKLIKEKKIKKEKPLPPITRDEIPFKLPKSWEWVRLGDVCSLITKGSSPRWQGVEYTSDDDGILFITSENVLAFKVDLSNEKYVQRKFNDIEPRSILKNGDFLMNIVGASIGRTALYEMNREDANINQAVCLIRLIDSELIKTYFLYFFNSRTCLNYMFDKQVDMARPNLSMGNIARFLIPVPPVEEQTRIVQKVDELMVLCDGLEKQVTENQTNSEMLMDAILREAFAHEA